MKIYAVFPGDPRRWPCALTQKVKGEELELTGYADQGTISEGDMFVRTHKAAGGDYVQLAYTVVKVNYKKAANLAHRGNCHLTLKASFSHRVEGVQSYSYHKGLK